MISKILKNQQLHFEKTIGRQALPEERFAGYRQNVIRMLDKCLNTIGPNVRGLIKSDKEVFYSEVKHLVKIIQWTKEKYLRSKENWKQSRFTGQGMDVDTMHSGDSSEEETKTVNPEIVRKVNGTFEKVRGTVYPKGGGKDSYYPNL